MLETADAGWYEEKNDPTPFIRYMLTVILACCAEFKDRVGLMDISGRPGTSQRGEKSACPGNDHSLSGQAFLLTGSYTRTS